jgi:hypothetical protein
MNQTSTSAAPPRKHYCGKCRVALVYVKRVVAVGTLPPVRVASHVYRCPQCDDLRAYPENQLPLPAGSRTV